MKKFLLLFFVAAFTVACGSVGKTPEQQAKEKIEAISKATMAGDFEKAMKLSAELEQWTETLNPEELEAVEAVAMQLAGDFMSDLGNNIGAFMEDSDLDEVNDIIEDEAERLLENIEDEADRLLEDIEDEAERLLEDIEDLW